ASTILALGICMPGDAQAQTTVNPVQTTTFTLDPAQNPITFGPATSIDTSATFNSDAVSGDTGTAWNVTNQGILQGNRRGVSLDGAGSILTNSGTISENSNLINSGAVVLGHGGTINNQTNGTISGIDDGVRVEGAAGTITNAGTITASEGT